MQVLREGEGEGERSGHGGRLWNYIRERKVVEEVFERERVEREQD